MSANRSTRHSATSRSSSGAMRTPAASSANSHGQPSVPRRPTALHHPGAAAAPAPTTLRHGNPQLPSFTYLHPPPPTTLGSMGFPVGPPMSPPYPGQAQMPLPPTPAELVMYQAYVAAFHSGQFMATPLPPPTPSTLPSAPPTLRNSARNQQLAPNAPSFALPPPPPASAHPTARRANSTQSSSASLTAQHSASVPPPALMDQPGPMPSSSSSSSGAPASSASQETRGAAVLRRAMDQVTDDVQESVGQHRAKRRNTRGSTDSSKGVVELFATKVSVQGKEYFRCSLCVGHANVSKISSAKEKLYESSARMNQHILHKCEHEPADLQLASELKKRRMDRQRPSRVDPSVAATASPEDNVSETELKVILNDFFSSGYIAFRQADNRPFRAFCDRLQAWARSNPERNYTPPSRTTLRNDLVRDVVPRRKAWIKDQLANALGRVMISFDGWTSGVQSRQYLAVSMSFVTRDWKRVDIPTSFFVEDGAAQLDLARQIRESMAEFGVMDREQILGVVCDNTAVNPAAIRHLCRELDRDLLGVLGMLVRCCAHTPQLFAKAIISVPLLHAVYRKIHRILVYITGSKSNARLNKVAKAVVAAYPEFGSAGHVLAPPSAGETRWGGIQDEVKYVIKYRDAIDHFASMDPSCPPMLNANELSLATLLVKMLEPLEVFTTVVQGETNSSKVALGFIHMYFQIWTAFNQRGVLDYDSSREGMDLYLSIMDEEGTAGVADAGILHDEEQAGEPASVGMPTFEELDARNFPEIDIRFTSPTSLFPAPPLPPAPISEALDAPENVSLWATALQEAACRLYRHRMKYEQSFPAAMWVAMFVNPKYRRRIELAGAAYGVPVDVIKAIKQRGFDLTIDAMVALTPLPPPAPGSSSNASATAGTQRAPMHSCPPSSPTHDFDIYGSDADVIEPDSNTTNSANVDELRD